MEIFKGVYYFLSPSLSPSRSTKLNELLQNLGAKLVIDLDDERLTHFITNTNRFERWQDVVAREEAGTLSVVTDKWVDKSVMHSKMQPESYYSADPAMIFSGVVGCASELPSADLEVLSAGITALGGQWRTGLTKDVTHLFAISPSSVKYSTALHFQEHTDVKVLLPHWFDDAVRLGLGGLETRAYEWPDPPLLRNSAASEGGDASKEKLDVVKRTATRKLDAQKKTLFKTSELLAPDAPLPYAGSQSSASASASPLKQKNVWQGRRVLLGRSLGLSESRREAIEAEVTRAGGVIVPFDGAGADREEEVRKVADCDVFVARYRNGRAYAAAVRQNKTIGTLPWVFHVQSTGVLAPPMDQLLWYPIPNKPIEGFSAHEITVTNYTGESREYLKRLIAAMGAKFTPSMSGKNTVLIAAFISGTKTSKAASWSIPIVNHTWLEDCFVKWRNLTVGTEKYIVFTPGVDFSLMLGERGVGRMVEEVGEEELEALEREEEEEEKEEELEKLETVVGKARPTGTQNSVRDAREVEELTTTGIGMDVDGDVQMDQPDLHEEEENAPEADMVVDHHEEPEPEPHPEQQEDEEDEREEEPASSPSKPTPKPTPTPRPSLTKSIAERMQESKGASAARTRIKPRPKGRATPKPTPGARSATPEVLVSRRKSGVLETTPVQRRTRREEIEAPPAGSSSSDDSEVEIVGAADKGKGKSKLVRRLGERSESWVMDAVVLTPMKGSPLKRGDRDQEKDEVEEEVEKEKKKTKKRTLQKSPSKQVLSSEEEEEEVQTSVVVRQKPKAKPKAAAKGKAVSVSDEEDGEEKEKKKTKKRTLKKSPSKQVLSSEEEEEEVQTSVVVRQKPKAKPKAAAKGKAASFSDEEDEVVEIAVSKAKGKKGAAATTTAKQAPLSEEEEEEEKPLKGKGRKPTAASSLTYKGKTKAKSAAKEDSEERESTEEEEEVVASTSRAKANGKGKGKAVETKIPKPKPVGKGKKVVEKVTEPPESEDDEEEEVPLPSKKKTPARSSTKKPATSPASDEYGEEDEAITQAKKSSAQSSAKAKKGSKAQALSSDDDEEEEEEAPPPPKAMKATTVTKSRGLQKTIEPTPSSASPSKTPKRAVSVLLPDLTLNTRTLRHPTTPLNRTESIRATAGERASTSRPNATASGSTSKSKPKAKTKVKAAPEPQPEPEPAASSPAPPTAAGEDGDTSMVISGRSKRGAAAKAEQKLREEIMPDVMNYEQQMRNAKGRKSLGGLPPAAPGDAVGKKRQSQGVDEEGDGEGRDAKRRRLSMPDAKKGKADADESDGEQEPVKVVKGKGKGKRKATEEEEEEVAQVSPNKKAKPVSSASSKTLVRLMTTQVSLSEDVVKALTKLGVKMTTKPSECTHLLAPHLVRTEKLLCAVANAAFILTDKWATESAAAKKLLDEGKYLLHDKANEKKFDFVLADALARAKKLNGSLFAKMVFYVTPKVVIDIKLLKNVVTACGGQVSTQPPTLRILSASPDRYIISCKDDISIWRPISRAHPVYTHELILDSALKQEIDWENEQYRVPGST